MSRSAHGHVCAAKNCPNKKRNCKVSYFTFPKDEDRCKQWVTACGREDFLVKTPQQLHRGYRLCGAHFENKMFLNDLKNRLQHRAVPTVFWDEGELGDSEHNYSSRAVVAKTSTAASENLPDESEEIMELEEQTLQMSTEMSTSPAATPPPEDPTPSTSGSVLLPTSSSIQTQTATSLSYNSPRKVILRQKLKKGRNDNQSLKRVVQSLIEKTENLQNLDDVTFEQFRELTYKFLPSKDLADFINSQITQIHHKVRTRRYSNDFKTKCLTVFFTSPKLYRTYLTKVFSLPSITDLRRFIVNINVTPGLNTFILEMLHAKINNFIPRNKMVVLCIDEMAIKANLFYSLRSGRIVGFEDCGDSRVFTPAQRAAVFMVKGLYNDWKQAVAFYFINSMCSGTKLKTIIYEIVTALQKIGLTICGLISDMASNNLQLSTLLEVSEEKPYFTVNEQKIVYIFDVPHLLRATRNNLLKYKLQVNDKTITWDDITNFYNHDKQYLTRAAPKLTNSHISPSSFEKKKVEFASQIFSNTVARGMNLYLRFEKLPARAVGTIEFITLMNKLFDIFNSNEIIGENEYNSAFKGLPYQIELLQQCLGFFKNIQVYNDNQNITHKIKCFKAWRISINSLIHLWDILKANEFKHLFTRRLNQDALDNMFGCIRQQGGKSVNATSSRFIRGYKKNLCTQLLHSGTASCINDDGTVLLKVTDLNILENDVTPVLQSLNERSVNIVDTDFRTSDSLQQNFTRYFCSYLIKKCLNIHRCETCEKFAQAHQNLDDSSLFCYFKAYENCSLDTLRNLQMPDDNFVYYIATLEAIFQQNFESTVMKDNVIVEFVNLYSQVVFKHPCRNFPYKYLKTLYSRVKLFYTLKYINEGFKTVNRDRKLIIWKHL